MADSNGSIPAVVYVSHIHRTQKESVSLSKRTAYRGGRGQRAARETRVKQGWERGCHGESLCFSVISTGVRRLDALGCSS